MLFQLGIASLLLPHANGMQSGSSNTMNNESKKKNALVIAPNFLKVHFKMNSAFANTLTEKFFVVGI